MIFRIFNKVCTSIWIYLHTITPGISLDSRLYRALGWAGAPHGHCVGQCATRPGCSLRSARRPTRVPRRPRAVARLHPLILAMALRLRGAATAAGLRRHPVVRKLSGSAGSPRLSGSAGSPRPRRSRAFRAACSRTRRSRRCTARARRARHSLAARIALTCRRRTRGAPCALLAFRNEAKRKTKVTVYWGGTPKW